MCKLNVEHEPTVVAGAELCRRSWPHSWFLFIPLETSGQQLGRSCDVLVCQTLRYLESALLGFILTDQLEHGAIRDETSVRRARLDSVLQQGRVPTRHKIAVVSKTYLMLARTHSQTPTTALLPVTSPLAITKRPRRFWNAVVSQMTSYMSVGSRTSNPLGQSPEVMKLGKAT